MPRQLMLLGPTELGYSDYAEEPLGPNSLRLQTLYSGVSHGTESLIFNGRAPKFASTWDSCLRLFVSPSPVPPYPMPLGYETVAQITSIGTQVSNFSIGDIVWIDAPHRETHTVEADQIASFQRLPPSLDPRVGVFLALSRVSLGAVHDAQPLIGDVAAVVGMGTIGLLCVQLLRIAGVRRIYAIDTQRNRLELASKFGAIPICVTDFDPASSVKAQSGGCDFVIESTGNYAGLDTAIRCAVVGGRVVVVSSYGDQREGVKLGYEFHRNRITLVSSMTINDAPHSSAPRWNLSRLNEESSRLLTTGALDVLSLISAEVSFTDAALTYPSISNSASPPIKMLISYAHD